MKPTTPAEVYLQATLQERPLQQASLKFTNVQFSEAVVRRLCGDGMMLCGGSRKCAAMVVYLCALSKSSLSRLNMLILDPVRHLCGDGVSLCGGLLSLCGDGAATVRNVLFMLWLDPRLLDLG